MIQFRHRLYKLEYDLMYFCGIKWLDRKNKTHGKLVDNVSIIEGSLHDSELIFNYIYK
jgi:hypothetical protein